mgnify:CR=1 FL=1
MRIVGHPRPQSHFVTNNRHEHDRQRPIAKGHEHESVLDAAHNYRMIDPSLPIGRERGLMSAREDILAEATRQFAARGFDGASLNDIAEAVGVRKASLLYHFPSKDELRKAVLNGLLSCWRERVPRLLMAATSGKGQFDALIRELLDFFSSLGLTDLA